VDLRDLIVDVWHALDPAHQSPAWPDPVAWDGRPLREQLEDLLVPVEARIPDFYGHPQDEWVALAEKIRAALAETEPDTQDLVALLSHYGAWATGGDPVGAAAEWAAAGFAAQTAEPWLEAECFRPRAARRLATLGVTPDEAATPIEVGGVACTLGYAVANGDLSAERALAMMRRDDPCR